MDFPEFIKGMCNKMCPSEEENMRIRERLLHFYELKPPAGGNKIIPIKAFSRSAAGCKQPKPSDLRTIKSLNNTVEYLLETILLDTRRSYNFVYDFIFDRLRSVRQEIVMQNIDKLNTIRLMEPMVMFFSYSLYILCPEQIDLFDPKICLQHLQECLKKLLCCYDDIDEKVASNCEYDLENRIFIECIYLLLNLGSVEALMRGISTSEHIRNNSLYKVSLKMCLDYFNGNFYRILHNIKKLPHVLAAIVSLKLPYIRHRILQQFSASYKTLPIAWTQRVLIYSHEKQFLSECKAYGIDVNLQTKQLKFVKGAFNVNSVVIKPSRESIIDEKLVGKNISEIVLLL